MRCGHDDLCVDEAEINYRQECERLEWEDANAFHSSPRGTGSWRVVRVPLYRTDNSAILEVLADKFDGGLDLCPVVAAQIHGAGNRGLEKGHGVVRKRARQKVAEDREELFSQQRFGDWLWSRDGLLQVDRLLAVKLLGRAQLAA